MDYTKEIKDRINEALTLLTNEVKNQLEIQGHKNTGRLERSIVSEVKINAENILGTAYMEEYGINLDTGIPADKIVLTQKYLNGLIEYFRSKGFAERSTKIAFMTARAHKREGMPTRGSYAFSSNGKRTGFIQDSWDIVSDEFEKIILDELITKVAGEVEIMINNTLRIAS